jgi:hypothetical protein
LYKKDFMVTRNWKKAVSADTSTGIGNEDTFVPKTFAIRMAAAIMPTLAGVGDGLSPVEKLRAQAKALRAGAFKRQTARNDATVKVETSIALAKAAAKK